MNILSLFSFYWNYFVLTFTFIFCSCGYKYSGRLLELCCSLTTNCDEHYFVSFSLSLFWLTFIFWLSWYKYSGRLLELCCPPTTNCDEHDFTFTFFHFYFLASVDIRIQAGGLIYAALCPLTVMNILSLFSVSSLLLSVVFTFTLTFCLSGTSVSIQAGCLSYAALCPLTVMNILSGSASHIHIIIALREKKVLKANFGQLVSVSHPSTTSSLSSLSFQMWTHH